MPDAAAEAAKPVSDYHAPGWQAAPTNVKDWADRCTDFTINGWGLKDPNNALLLVSLFSDPEIYLEFAQRSLDPEAYARMLNTLLDPAAAANFLEWSDPVIYSKWTTALADPNFLSRLSQPLIDPATYMRWLSAPMDARWWSVGMQLMNPAVWMKWMTAPANPKVLAPLLKAADPNTSLQWSQTVSNPARYRFWNAPTPVPANPNAGPALNPGAPSPFFNPFAGFNPEYLPPTGAGPAAVSPNASEPPLGD